MTKNSRMCYEPVAEKDPEDKPKVVEVHDGNPLPARSAAWRWHPSAR